LANKIDSGRPTVNVWSRIAGAGGTPVEEGLVAAVFAVVAAAMAGTRAVMLWGLCRGRVERESRSITTQET